MDVTPPKKMFDSMVAFCEATLGPMPSPLEIGSAAQRKRERHREGMNYLHALVGMAMKVGVDRAMQAAQAIELGPQDADDRRAIQQAKDDAEAGATRTHLQGIEQVRH